ncbi:MAG: winged helix-turn-helix domain-containing protein [Desulfobulbaceae bacterium]|jgi:transposase|nr:winged helix-turn-helix domain-containing protein [Desulfobulbaceae bacterium]
MARPSSGGEFLAEAKAMLAKAKTVEELRQAQAVILPLEYGFSMERVAAITGVSRGWACQLRRRFIRNAANPVSPSPKRGGRHRENMSVEEEKIFLAPFIAKAAKGGILVVAEIKRALDAHLGREVAVASVYNLLHRHSWRKLAPDKRHHRADVEVQTEWGKKGS